MTDKLLTFDPALHRPTGPWIAGGHPDKKGKLIPHATRRRAARRAVPAFVAHENSMRDTAKLLTDAANERRAEERPEPLVYGPLVIGVDPTTQEQRVLSERRREFWPGTSPEFADAERVRFAGDQSLSAAIKTVGLVGALKGRLSKLFRNT